MANASAAAGEKKGGGIVGILVVTLLAAGGGGGFGTMLAGDLKKAEPAKPVTAVKHAPPTAIPAASKLVDLKPIIVNLAEPETAWVRLEASLLIEGELEGMGEVVAKVGEDLVAFLKTTRLSQLGGGSGFQSLREDLNERARLRGGAQVRELVVYGFVVE